MPAKKVVRLKTRMNVWILPEQKEALDRISARHGAPISELVRRAVADYIRKEK
jgi:hypothetical protein